MENRNAGREAAPSASASRQAIASPAALAAHLGRAPVTVVAAADEAARLDPTGRRLTVAEILGPPRCDSLPDRVRDALSRERGRVTGLQPADPEAVAAAWIEVVEELPWRRSEERPGAPAALRRAFDREHVGRGREKDQEIDYLVARQAAAERHAAGVPADDAVVLCLRGPAGIGGTAFARALAAALGRRSVRVSLAGVEDAAAIHGVARPAPDAGPGRLVRALRGLGPLPGRISDDPLVLLGELDRLGGAAADALLGAIDPARNHAFRDRYVGLPLDLGGALFVATGTKPADIPPLLRERLELLTLAGYTAAEKERNAAGHLIPGARRRHGLSGGDLSFSPAALGLLVRGYSREPGVRGLDGRIDAICRRGARPRTEGLPPPGEMTPETVAVWLGAPRFRDARTAGRTCRPGVAVGLAATATGGEVLVVETACLPGRGQLRVTGTAGPLLRESGDVALTWVRERGSPRRCRRARRLDGRAHAPGRGRPVEGRPVRGRHARRRPRLGAHRAAGAGRHGHDRRTDVLGAGGAGGGHPGEGARGGRAGRG